MTHSDAKSRDGLLSLTAEGLASGWMSFREGCRGRPAVRTERTALPVVLLSGFREEGPCGTRELRKLSVLTRPYRVDNLRQALCSIPGPAAGR